MAVSFSLLNGVGRKMDALEEGVDRTWNTIFLPNVARICSLSFLYLYSCSFISWVSHIHMKPCLFAATCSRTRHSVVLCRLKITFSSIFPVSNRTYSFFKQKASPEFFLSSYSCPKNHMDSSSHYHPLLSLYFAFRKPSHAVSRYPGG